MPRYCKSQHDATPDITVTSTCTHMQAFKYGMLTILVKSRGSSPEGKYASTSSLKRLNTNGLRRK